MPTSSYFLGRQRSVGAASAAPEVLLVEPVVVIVAARERKALETLAVVVATFDAWAIYAIAST